MNDLPSPTITGDNAVCEDESGVTYTTEASMTNYVWSVIGGTITSGATTNEITVTWNSVGNQSVSVNYDNANGCSATNSTVLPVTVNTVSVTMSVSPPASPTNTSVCAGESLTYQAFGSDGSGNYNYVFELRSFGGVFSEVANSTSPVYSTSTSLAPGSYEIHVIIEDIDNGCTSSSNISQFSVFGLPNASIDPIVPSEYCYGETVTITAKPDGYDNYTFYLNGNPVDNGTNNTINVDTLSLVNSSVYVRVTSGGCSSNSTPPVDITINPLPIPTLVSDHSSFVCENESVEFTAGGGDLYEFILNGIPVAGGPTADNTFTHSSTAAFDVAVRVIDNKGCDAISSTITTGISIPNATINASNNSICLGDEVTFTATGGVLYSFYVDGLLVKGPSDSATYTSSALVDGNVVNVQIVDSVGCSATSADITMVVNPIPTSVITSSDIDLEICKNESVTFTASSDIADEFEFFVNSVSLGRNASSSYVTDSLNNGDEIYVVSYNSITGCSSESTHLTFVVNSLPVAVLSANPGNSILEGTNVTFTASGGVEYRWYVNNTMILDYPGSEIIVSDTLSNGTTVSVVVKNANGCEDSTSIVMTVFDSVIPLDVKANVLDYCEDANGVSVYISNPQGGIVYELIRNSDGTNLGAGVLVDSIVTWSNVKNSTIGTEEFMVEGYNPSVPAARVEMNNRLNITEHALPVQYSISPVGTVTDCNSGAGYDVKLLSSQLGVTYELYINNNPTGIIIAGTGNEISFGPQVTIGEYSIVAELDIVEGCSSVMNGLFRIDVVVGDIYNVTSVPSDGRFCAGSNGIQIILDGSTVNVSYVLMFNNAIRLDTIIGDGGAIDFGYYNQVGNYSVIVDESGCVFPMNGVVNAQQVELPWVFEVIASSNGHFCMGDAGVDIWIAGQQQGVDYVLLFNGMPVDTVSGVVNDTTTNTYFNGSFNSVGTYSVEAYTQGIGCNVSMSNSVTLTEDALPALFNAISDGDFCAGSSTQIHLQGSESNVNYRLERVGDGITTSWIAGNGGILDFDVSEIGSYIINAERNDGLTNCSVYMNDTIIINEIALPDTSIVFSVTGEGEACVSGDTVSIFSGETDVIYELVKFDGVIEIYTGNTVIGGGPGSQVDFNPVMDRNATYIVQATRLNCSVFLPGSVDIDVSGAVSLYGLTGSGDICNGDPGQIFGITGSDFDTWYELWLVDGALDSIGNRVDLLIEGPVKGTGLPLDFNLTSNEGVYYVMGDNGNGCKQSMIDSVTLKINELPTAFQIVGSGFYCDTIGASIQLEASETNVAYTLQFKDDVTGFKSNIVSNIVGSGNPISFGYYNNIYANGEFFVIARNTLTGCTSNMNGSVRVMQKSSVTNVNILRGTNLVYCSDEAGTSIETDTSELDVVYSLVSAITGDSIALKGRADGAGLNFGYQPEGLYTLYYGWGGDACMMPPINITITEDIKPNDYLVTADKTNVCGSDTNAIRISSSDLGVKYALFDAGIALPDTLNGNGGELSWAVNVSGDYFVKAFLETSSCSTLSNMVIVSVNDAPAVLNVIPDTAYYCSGEPGVQIGLESAERNTYYELLDTLGEQLDVYVPKDSEVGYEFYFRTPQLEGKYLVRGRYFSGGCITLMPDTAVVIEDNFSGNCKPLIAVDDVIYVGSEDNSVVDSVFVNDIINPVIDSIGVNLVFELLTAGTKDDGRFFTTKGKITIDNYGNIEYTRIPGFYGWDYAMYIIKNTNLETRVDTALIAIMVGNEPIEDGTLMIPNAFSPNGDNFNQQYRIEGLIKADDYVVNVTDETVKSNLEVYNRWGTLVYRSKGDKYKNDWEGKGGGGAMFSIGDDLPNGTYFYIFKVRFNLPDKTITKEYTGFIELRR
ncbi:MAG: gliding motility-associated C-terminal domain-containing protein [Marinilabiliaceae bacterium]|nr:gliding motility-associated C-terminal domain-containing protein [Marinilabiliaceae bacterium]